MGEGPPALATARLVLRPLELADAEAVQAMFPRWEIVRYLGTHVPWPYPADGALTFIREKALPGTEQGLEWHWTIRLKTSSERLIGMINLLDHGADNRGFWLDPAEHGRGLMTEASAAVTDYWFGVLDRPMLRVGKSIANEPSRRISQRAGMRLVAIEVRDVIAGRLPSEVYEISREEWREGK